jgi:hypothetical protein
LYIHGKDTNQESWTGDIDPGPFEIDIQAVDIGKYKVGKEKGNPKFKQVTVRHLRPYNPFER